MDKADWTYRLCFKQLDENNLANLLWRQKEDLFLPEFRTAENIVDHIFAKGGALAAFDPYGQMQAMIGFLFGSPADNYADQDTVFIYVAAVEKSYRTSRVFLKGLLALANQSKQLGIETFKLQASLTDAYNNRLYSKFATPVGEGLNPRGYPVMNYSGHMNDILSKFGSRLP